jgi:hypothetical protein
VPPDAASRAEIEHEASRDTTADGRLSLEDRLVGTLPGQRGWPAFPRPAFVRFGLSI